MPLIQQFHRGGSLEVDNFALCNWRDVGSVCTLWRGDGVSAHAFDKLLREVTTSTSMVQRIDEIVAISCVQVNFL